MLRENNGKKEKPVCPYCGGSNIGESGLGQNYLHCFGSCMADIPVHEVVFVEASDDELSALSQEPY